MWWCSSSQIFIAKRENGESPATDPSGSDPDGLVKSIGVIAMLSGKSGLLDTVEKCVKVTQVRLSVCLNFCQLVCLFVKYCLCMIESAKSVRYIEKQGAHYSGVA